MRRCLAAMPALAAFFLTGCFIAPSERSVSRFDAKVPFTCLTGEDVVQLDVFVVERPAGDPCINREIWELTDEQVLGERKALLEENGLRAGVLGETPPDSLRTLLCSERSCANPRRLRLHAGKPTQILLGPAAARTIFQLRQDDRSADVDLEQAQCLLQATTRIADDGRMTLEFSPAVRHGQPQTMPRPVPEASGTLRWDVPTGQPTETYRGLGWEFTVAPNTYIAVGLSPDHPGTLGEAAFLGAGPPRMQRLLVLRPARVIPDKAPAGQENDKSPPLALQAGAASARGAGP